MSDQSRPENEMHATATLLHTVTYTGPINMNKKIYIYIYIYIYVLIQTFAIRQDPIG